MKVFLPVLMGWLAAIGTAAADLRTAQPFQDHMVLQRQMTVPIWGWDDAGKSVTVKFGDKSATAKADDKGYWIAKLPAMEANATGQDVTISDGAKTITLKDVLIGEVWLCAGQSNMSRSVKGEMTENPQAPKEIYTGDTDHPAIRFINYPNAASDTPLADMDPQIDGKATWEVVGPDTVGDSFAMAWYFARELNKQLNVPVGLVEVAVAGTTQTAWCSKNVLDSVKVDGARSYSYDDCFAEAEKGLAKNDTFKSWAEYKSAVDAWRANPTGRPPGSIAACDYPGVLYNALVHPLAPMAIRGALWHQGEAGPALKYGERLVAMINDWRKDFGQDFYFLYGTMTRFTKSGPPLTPAAESLRSGINDEFQLAQKLFGENGKGYMVGMMDLGNVGTHWQRKDEAGRRLALGAMDHVYGKPSVYTGPILVDSKIDGGTVTLRFSNVGTGLKYEPSIDGISGFILADKDKAVWGTPKIVGADTVTVSDPSMPAPGNLYYGYDANPHETLFNSEGLTAFPFKLQSQPVVRDKPKIQVVEPGTLTDAKATMNLSDVRRYAYVVGFENWHGVPGANQLKCYIPKEWAKPAAQQDGKDVPLGDLTTDSDGNRFATVSAESNGPSVILYDASHPEALAAANTKRY